MEQALLAAGWFWGVEEIFRTTNGIIDTKVGYSGGHKINPTYEEVCTGNTDHAEVVKIEYDESIITYDQILNIFFENHDPTQLNRQGVDIGTQYRSSIFYNNENQKLESEQKLNSLQGDYNNNIVTEIKKATEFYLAEEYHQQYVAKGGICHF